MRQRARAGAKLIHLTRAAGLQSLLHLHRQGAAKQGREFRRCDKVTARCRALAKLGQGIGVVTQTRLVQSQGFKMVKADPAARGLDGVTDNLGQLRRNIFGRHVGLHRVFNFAVIIRPNRSGQARCAVRGAAHA